MRGISQVVGGSALLVTLLGVSALTGCGDSETNGNGGSGGSGSTSSSSTTSGTGGGTGGAPAAKLPDTLGLEGEFYPESVAAGAGKLFASSFSTGEIRVFDLSAPEKASTFVPPAKDELSASWGLVVDEARNWLVACANAPLGKPASKPAEIRAYDVASGALVKTWALPSGAVGNSVTLDKAGNIYVSDVSATPRIVKIDPGSDAVSVWKEDAQWVANMGFGLGGMSFDGASSLYGSGSSDKLWRVPINADGSAGALTFIPVTDGEGKPVNFQADGFQTVDGSSFVAALNDVFSPGPQGSLVKVTVDAKGEKATMVPVGTGLADPSGAAAYTWSGKRYAFAAESQLGVLFGVDMAPAKTPFTIRVYGL